MHKGTRDDYIVWNERETTAEKFCHSCALNTLLSDAVVLQDLFICEVGLGLSKVLKKVLKKVNLLKKVLKKVNLLKKALKKALKKVNLLKKGLKKEQPVKKVNSRKCIHSKK